jgi:hypothetical protein
MMISTTMVNVVRGIATAVAALSSKGSGGIHSQLTRRTQLPLEPCAHSNRHIAVRLGTVERMGSRGYTWTRRSWGRFERECGEVGNCFSANGSELDNSWA